VKQTRFEATVKFTSVDPSISADRIKDVLENGLTNIETVIRSSVELSVSRAELPEVGEGPYILVTNAPHMRLRTAQRFETADERAKFAALLRENEEFLLNNGWGDFVVHIEATYEDRIDAYDKSDEACPTCGCEPGDGVTKGCKDPDGCGYWIPDGYDEHYADDASMPAPLATRPDSGYAGAERRIEPRPCVVCGCWVCTRNHNTDTYVPEEK
jgi:hypothetical protein